MCFNRDFPSKKAKSPTGGSSALAALNLDSGVSGAHKRLAKEDHSGGGLGDDQDSFYAMYNKEIKVNQSQIPIILAELTDAAYNFAQRDQYEKALVLLQKTEGVLEVVNLETSSRDKSVKFITCNNMAVCFQKLSMLDECANYLKQSLEMFKQPGFMQAKNLAQRNRRLKLECKLRLQLCAILSQTQNHTEALARAKESLRLIHQLFHDLLELCKIYIDKINYRENLQAANDQSDLEDEERQQILQLIHNSTPTRELPKNFLEQSISLVERSSLKLHPVVKEVCKRLAGQDPAFFEELGGTESNLDEEDEDNEPDMRSVLGFLNQNEWVQNLNIGNIMQITPLQMSQDFLSTHSDEIELSRDSFLEKLSILAVCYFCMSTEMRFLLHSRGKYLKPEVKEEREIESEYWHAKSLEIACTFLPSECPLLKHILLSYQKHHDPSNHAIKENEAASDTISVLRPIAGVENSKFNPIIRMIKCPAQVKISPRADKLLRDELRKNNEELVETVLKHNPAEIKRFSPPRDLAEKQVQVMEPYKSRMNSMDLERQILSVTPPEFSNKAPIKSQFDIISQEMGVFDSQDTQVDQASQEKEAQLFVSQLLDNTKIDKKLMLNILLSQLQMSGELPQSMSRDILHLQRHLKSETSLPLPTQNQSDYHDLYDEHTKKHKNVSYIDNAGDSLFKDEKSPGGLEEYADLMDQIAGEQTSQQSSSQQHPNQSALADILESQIVDTNELLQGVTTDEQEQCHSSSREKSKTRPSTTHTTATNQRLNSNSQNRLRKGRLNYVPVRQDRSGSSMRSLTGGVGYQTVKPKKTASKTSIVCEHHHNSSNHGISGKENDSMQINHPKISKASTRKTMKRRDHNYSTSSSQIPTSSMISLKKVLPGKVKRKKQNSSSPKPAKLVAANIAAADECLDLIDQAALSPEKRLRNTSSGRQRKTSPSCGKNSSKSLCRNRSNMSNERKKLKRAEEKLLQPSGCQERKDCRDVLQKQALANQQKLLQQIGGNKKSFRPASQPKSTHKHHGPHINHLAKRPISCKREPKATTMKMSSSGQNFPQAGLFRAQNAETQPLHSIIKKTNKRHSIKNKSGTNQMSPQQFKKALINEVDELKARMKDHFRHISNLSPERSASKNSKHSRSASRSRSRKSRSPNLAQPKRARIPQHKVKQTSHMKSAAMIELAEKLKQTKAVCATSNSFDKSNQLANHSLSMFDTEVEGVAGNLRHQLSQHGGVGHNSSASIPTQKILPLKKVARVPKAASYATHSQTTQNSNHLLNNNEGQGDKDSRARLQGRI